MSPATSSPTSAAEACVLGRSLDIYHADELRAALRTRLAGSNDTVIDLSGVEACDTTGLQLLLSARKTAAAAGGRLRFVHPSPAIVACCRQLGVPESF